MKLEIKSMDLDQCPLLDEDLMITSVYEALLLAY